MIIGCVSFVRVGGKIVTIECAKGRGRILPGGKWEKPETFKETADRELREETGLIATSQEYIFGAMSTDGAYVHCFRTEIMGFKPTNSTEGKVYLSTWKDLMSSQFQAYYELLYDILKQRDQL